MVFFQGKMGSTGIQNLPLLLKSLEEWSIEEEGEKVPVTAKNTFDEDDNLVFYPATKDSFQKIKENIKTHKLNTYRARNPYWKDKGLLIKDPDGFNIFICSLKLTD